jgi:hypothetical protein
MKHGGTTQRVDPGPLPVAATGEGPAAGGALSRLLAIALAVALAVALAAVLAAALAASARQPPAPVEILYGDSVAIGDGVIRTWIERDEHGAPLALGVTLPELVFPALTDEGFMLSLDYPEMPGLPFRHVLFDWVPHGHPPAGLYAHAHWDAHFYTIPAHERRAIEGGPTEARPDARFMPEGYVPVPGLGLFAFPEMGVHWMSEDAAELHGHTFGQTLIYGSTGEKTIFVEPMFTMAYLETKPDLTAPVPWPEAVQESGYYPTRYVIRHLPEDAAFRIALEGFRWRNAE